MFIAAKYDNNHGFYQLYGKLKPEKTIIKIIIMMAKKSVQSLLAWMMKPQYSTDNVCEV